MNPQRVTLAPLWRSRQLVLVLALAACAAIGGASMATLAEAKQVNGTKKADKLRGSKKADKINGRGGNDKINGRKGRDKLKGGPGKDTINAVDKAKDKKINGGPGRDVCKIDKVDRKRVRGCEKIVVKGAGGTGGGGNGGGGGGTGGGGSGGGGAGETGPLTVDASEELVCAPGALPLCAFTLSGTGADALVGTVTGGGGVTAAVGAGATAVGEDWTAVGTYSCTSDGFLRVTIGSEIVDVPVTCSATG